MRALTGRAWGTSAGFSVTQVSRGGTLTERKKETKIVRCVPAPPSQVQHHCTSVSEVLHAKARRTWGDVATANPGGVGLIGKWS